MGFPRGHAAAHKAAKQRRKLCTRHGGAEPATKRPGWAYSGARASDAERARALGPGERSPRAALRRFGLNPVPDAP